jgi:hypothetical protein
VTVEVVYQAPTTPEYCYFMTSESAAKLRRAAELGRPVSVALVTAEADVVENNPEMFVDLVKIEVNWKAE